jgi:hypothetical protein
LLKAIHRIFPVESRSPRSEVGVDVRGEVELPERPDAICRESFCKGHPALPRVLLVVIVVGKVLWSRQYNVGVEGILDRKGNLRILCGDGSRILDTACTTRILDVTLEICRVVDQHDFFLVFNSSTYGII